MGERIVVINPNSSEDVTEGIDAALDGLRLVGGPEIDCLTLADGPPGIESQRHVDGVIVPLCRLALPHPPKDERVQLHELLAHLGRAEVLIVSDMVANLVEVVYSLQEVQRVEVALLIGQAIWGERGHRCLPWAVVLCRTAHCGPWARGRPDFQGPSRHPEYR